MPKNTKAKGYFEEDKKGMKKGNMIIIDEDYPGVIRKIGKYVYEGDLILWEDKPTHNRHKRKLFIELDRPFRVLGDMKVNGYIKTVFSSEAAGRNHAGDNYEAV